MQLKPGTRLKSTVCTTEVVVGARTGRRHRRAVRRRGDGPVQCARHAPGGSIDPIRAEGTRSGKRYADDQIGLELLCTKDGDGSLFIGDTPILAKDAKPLPSSD